MKKSKIDLKKKLKNLMNEKGITQSDFCDTLGMTVSNLYKIYERNTIDTKYLEIIDDKFNVHPGYFFSDSNNFTITINGNKNNVKDISPDSRDRIRELEKELEASRNEIKLLRELIESKNELIKQLQK